MSEFDYNRWPTAPCVCRNDSRDFTIRDGDLVHFVLADTLPYASLVWFMEGNNQQPRFVYPAAVLTFRNPELYGRTAIFSPESIISVECLNFASMQQLPLEGEIETMDDLFGSLQLGQAKIGQFRGEMRRLLGDCEDISDFDGMVETLLGIAGINAERDDSAPPPLTTYLYWLKKYA